MAVVSGTLAFGAGGAVAANCEGLVGKNFGDAMISAATNVAPPFNVAGKDPPTPVSVNRPFCRVEGVLKPSTDSADKAGESTPRTQVAAGPTNQRLKLQTNYGQALLWGGLAREAVQYALLQPLRPDNSSVTGRVALEAKQFIFLTY